MHCTVKYMYIWKITTQIPGLGNSAFRTDPITKLSLTTISLLYSQVKYVKGLRLKPGWAWGSMLLHDTLAMGRSNHVGNQAFYLKVIQKRLGLCSLHSDLRRRISAEKVVNNMWFQNLTCKFNFQTWFHILPNIFVWVGYLVRPEKNPKQVGPGKEKCQFRTQTYTVSLQY